MIIDTPGMRELAIWDGEEGLRDAFSDVEVLAAKCRFRDCTHTHEPGCAVLSAIEEHRIAPSRYASYLSMLDDKEEGKYRAAF
ncbi:MAG: ribosome small subunit-dependent GTPase A, partial [Bacteroidaceae bacterium]|nr:ribosome small subunit-dependent GTPase A [Bacteroidaceae bacterium]